MITQSKFILKDQPNNKWHFCRYYGSEIGDTKSYIVLGDFDQDGFRMCQQKANLSLEHILIAGKLSLLDFIFIQA